MKAVRLLEYGGELAFDDVPAPTIARDEILVKINSTAVNHLDLVKASGAARQILPIDLPWIPGHEFSGVVEQIGREVAAFAPGDAVFGISGMGRTRNISLPSRRPSQGNHPISPLRRRHQCRWPPKLRGKESSPTVTWKGDKRSSSMVVPAQWAHMRCNCLSAAQNRVFNETDLDKRNGRR
jgi:hypothetical protein